MAFRNVAPQDRKALKEWVEHHSADGDFDAFMASLPSLPTGEGWVWSPEFMGIFERIKIRTRETFHPDREKLGSKFTMPEITQTDIQGFIEKFAAQKPVKETKEKPGKAVADMAPATKTEIAQVRNEYESQLIEKDTIIRQKDAEIRRLHGVIEAVQRAVGSSPDVVSVAPTYQSPNVDMWIEKVGGEKSGGGRILRFLSEKIGMKFTRSQIALAIGMSSRGGSYLGYIQTLKRNKLIVEEDGYLSISSDL